MNLALLDGPLAQAIGWALLHLLWQGALVAGFLALLLPRLAGHSANLRYAVSCSALALMVVLGVATAFKSYSGTSPGPAVTSSPFVQVSVAPSAVTPVVSAAPPPSLVLMAVLHTTPGQVRRVVRTANESLPGIVFIWLVGVAFLSTRLIVEWQRARRLVSRSTTPARADLQSVASRLASALGVRHVVRLLESAAIEVPSVIGLVRPAILLPASTLAGLTPAQLEMILAHELAHIRRHDFLVNLLQSTVETLLFYHPAVWWVSRQVRIERENCCDDIAVALCGNPVHYARALARLEELRPHRLPLAVSAAGGSLFERVRRLVDGSARPNGPAVRGASALAVLSCLVLAFAAQSFAGIGARRSDAEQPRMMEGLSALTTSFGVMAKLEPTSSDAPIAANTKPAPKSAPKPATKPAAKPDAPPSGEDTRPTLEELIALRTQNVTPEMVREMRTLFPDVELMEIASMRAVGVTPDYVRGMRQMGLEIASADEAQGLVAVGVTPNYVRAMREAGFALKSADEAQGLRAVGVTPEYVRAMREAGFPLKSASEAQGLMAVGVTPSYVRGMREAGVKLDSANDVQSLAAQGVTPAFVRKLADAGYPNLTVSQLSRLAAAGVTGDFIKEMSQYRSR